MPIYEYVCPRCHNRFEQLLPLSQADQEGDCPQCHHPARRKMSTFACFSSNAGANTRIAGTGGSSCSSCGSGNCSSCAS